MPGLRRKRYWMQRRSNRSGRLVADKAGFAVFYVSINAVVDSRPPNAVLKSLEHLNNAKVAFVCELKYSLTELHGDEFAITAKKKLKSTLSSVDSFE